jgi:hypothetical protein
MPHKLTALIASAALIAIASASYAAAGVAQPASQRSLPSLFAKQVRSVNRAARAPAVLLPRSMPLGARHLYPSGGPDGSRYDLEIGAVRHCGDADACFVAAFSAAKASKVFGKRVHVRGASKAGFIPLSCGASCAPPQIDFLVGGIRYTIQANLNARRGDRAALIAAAESAISAGPR